jgi:hypothetical protein
MFLESVLEVPWRGTATQQHIPPNTGLQFMLYSLCSCVTPAFRLD